MTTLAEHHAVRPREIDQFKYALAPATTKKATIRIANFANLGIMDFVEVELKKNRPFELNRERF